MKRKNTTRSALFTSIISLLLCVSMLVGTTFAWFTDEVNSGINTIAAGNLDVELHYASPKGEDGNIITDYAALDWKPVDSTTELFNNEALWEPGYAEAVYLKIVNAGSLALKYNLTINIVDEMLGTSVLGNEIKLSDILLVNMEETYLEEGETPSLFATRDEATFDIGQFWGISLHKTIANKEGDTDVALLPDEEVFVKLAIYMPTTTGNEANHVTGTQQPQINMGLKLTAAQLEYESDSFGPDYDEDAQYFPVVTSAADLIHALQNGQSVTLGNDIDLEETLVVPEGVTVTLNLNGYTLTTDLQSEGRHHYAIDNYGTLTLVGDGAINARGVENFGTMTVDGDLTITNVDTNGGAAIWNEGTLTIHNGTFTTNAAAGAGSYGAALNNQSTGTATIYGGTYIANSNLTYAVLNEGGTMTIHDANVTGKHGAVYGADIYGGTYVQNDNPNTTDWCAYGCTLYGGTYSAENDTSAGGGVFCDNVKIADYYTTVDNGDGTYSVVPHENVYTISNAEELIAFGNKLNNGASSRSAAPSQPTYILTADIDMDGHDWTPVAYFTDVFDGQGHTISNLNISGVSKVGFFGEISSAEVKNVNFDNVTVNGNHFVGVLFGWEGAESVQSYVENVHVTNSTVTVTPENENGDKVGGIGGYAVTTTITDCSVTDTKITAYRDAGGILGYAHKKAVVKDNTVSDVTMVWDNSDNYKNYTDVSEADLGVYVGEAEPTAIVPVESADADKISDALADGGDVVLTEDVESEATTTAPYGNKVGYIQNGGVLDGNGNTLSVECYGDDYGVMTSGGTIKNLTIDSGCRAIMIMSPTEDIIIDNVYVCGDILYPINTGEHATVEGIDLIVTNSTFGGWSSFAGIASASFTDCTFIEGEYGYGWPYETLVKPYVTTTFTNCEFALDGEGNAYYLDLSALGADCTVTLANCTVNGTVITAENCAELFGEVELPEGRTLANCVIFK